MAGLIRGCVAVFSFGCHSDLATSMGFWCMLGFIECPFVNVDEEYGCRAS